ncbi:crossover junction endodeoxyribonuclease RuvC [Anaerovirgula multivorans]|uniref:Crossover junction endodeoxyribonuclease RuvC n=1 Tax=Anaerovirgula multivorans TaxID=312168 RepID=A0A239CP06_9FIRM|nr:crossover junction endodeoxyribonuclease RuvC [Anaerovirgula multivorans]SNS21073.1 crossover junction endodeoxyribonuclease RuvC [Anaerovirgula multivorans]
MYFIGIDPSLTGTGLIILNEDGEIVLSRCIVTKQSKQENHTQDTMARVKDIKDCIMSELKGNEYKIYVAVEGFSYGSRGRAVFDIAYMGYRIREELLDTDITFIEPTPSQVKKFATGKGNSPKNVVMLEVYKRWGEEFTDDNLADAYVLAQIVRALKTNARLTKFQQDIIKDLKGASVCG